MPATLEELRKLGLPVVVVETVNNEEPTCDVAYPPEGCMGTGITNATKVQGRVRMYDAQAMLFDSGEYLKDKSGMTIKIRGNSSGANVIKRPYKIKLQKKADMLCRGNDAKYKDKNWVLLRSDEMRADDSTEATDTNKRMVKEKFINPIIGFKVNELLGMQWTPQMQFVNLLFNGDYRGIYVLCESVEHNEGGRIDVNKENGYIFEYDAYWWNADVYFETATGNKFTFKYPDTDEIPSETIDYIRDVVDTLEAHIQQGGYDNLIDVESFAAWMLAHDILGTLDGAGSNIFITKYDNTPSSKVKMGNLWDFDTIMQHSAGWGSIRYAQNFWFYKLFQSPDPTFVIAYKKLWEEQGTNCVQQILEYLQTFEKSATATAIDNSMQLDAKRWNRLPGSVSAEVARAQTWFEARKQSLDMWIPTISTGISTPAIETAPSLYDLQGRRINGVPHKGVYIENGKKMLAR